MPSIVTVNASVTTAPAPILLQQTGAFVTQGGTNLPANTYSLLTQAPDYTALQPAALAISTLSWSGGTVVATTTASIPGLTTNDTFTTTIAGATPTGYNGTVTATVTGANTFTYPLSASPGSETVPGTYTPPGQGDLQAAVNTFFAQGTNRAVYVLELGAGDATTGPTALQTWITTNPGVFYAYLVPRGWDASAGLLTLANNFTSPTAKTYFFGTTTTGSYSTYTTPVKSLIVAVEAPARPLTEFSLASPFQVALNYAPSASNRQTQFAFSYLYGVTAYPTVGNNATLTALKAANVNYVGTGAEGGLSNTILYWGDVLTGEDFSWWYSADWAQLNCDQTAANIVINGSNNPLNPLYYNQSGIDQLQDGIVGVVNSAVSYGLAAGSVTRTTLDPVTFSNNLAAGVYAGQNVINAVPFSTYVAQNPNDYAIGKYAGISVVYIPQNGFKQIVFNLDITNLLNQ